MSWSDSTEVKVRAWLLAAEWVEEGARRATTAERASPRPSLEEERAIRHAAEVVAESLRQRARIIRRRKKVAR